MNKYINLLLQVQDLEIARRESLVLHADQNHTKVRERLGEHIGGLIAGLPRDVAEIHERIRAHYDLFVVPMLKETCTGCFMRLPVGIVGKVKNDNQWVSCPTCNRFLYHDYLLDHPTDDHLRYKGVARFSSQDLMFPRIKAKDKAAAISEIARRTVATGFVEDEETFAEGLLEREEVVSTAVGSGLAFPHARGVRACGLTLAVGTSPGGIDFGEGEKVHLLFVSAVPLQTSMFYIELVSKLARYFSKPESIQRMLECADAEEMWKILVKIGK
jgi:mannitol/fructose-specific phosphotransferase system IIA component (Ntr-type)